MDEITHDLKNKCLKIAQIAHQGQIRKGSGLDYIVHPKRVSELVKKEFSLHPKINTLICAAILHDVIEDSDMTKEKLGIEVGEEIANLVQELSEDKSISKPLRHEKYKEKLCCDSDAAKILKLCDIYDNLADNPVSIDFINRCKDISQNLDLSDKASNYEKERFNDFKKKTFELIKEAKENFKEF